MSAHRDQRDEPRQPAHREGAPDGAWEPPVLPQHLRGDDTCDVCGAPARSIRCKIVCSRCGATRDCSDP